MPSPRDPDLVLPVLSPGEELDPLDWPMQVDAAGATDRGLVRPRNEDAYLIAELDRHLLIRDSSIASNAPSRWRSGRQAVLLAVADGMGGHDYGALASQVVLDALAGFALHEQAWPAHPGDPGGDARADAAQELCRALAACQARLTEVTAPTRATERAERAPGTTLTAAFIVWPSLLALHAGDSRLYLLRQGVLHQITHDHTLFTDPDMPHQRPASSPMRHVLDNAIVSGPEPARCEVHHVVLEPADRVLVCSDGLTEHVSDRTLAHLLGEGRSPSDTCAALIDTARAGGGTDNITAVVGRFVPVTATGDSGRTPVPAPTE